MREQFVRLSAFFFLSCINNNNKWPLTPKSMPATGGEHAKPKT